MRWSIALAALALGCGKTESSAPPAPVAVSASSAAPVASSAAPVAAPSAAPSAAASAGSGGDAGASDAVSYVLHTNEAWGFSCEVPATFQKRPADSDGRGQGFFWKNKATMRAWAAANSPRMSLKALFEDWTRRTGILEKEMHEDPDAAGDEKGYRGWWRVVAKEPGGKIWFTKSFVADGLLTTVELTYDAAAKDEMEPIAQRVTSSLRLEPTGRRAKKK